MNPRSGLFCRKLAIVLMFCVFGTVAIYAQATTGAILGKVSDSSGAVIVNAAIKAVNTQTGESRSAQTNELGEYIFPTLPVGVYVISAEQAGFKRSIRNEVQLAVNENGRVDFSLEVGNVEQSVEVSADATHVNTENAQLGQLVDSKRVEDLPLNGRDAYDL